MTQTPTNFSRLRLEQLLCWNFWGLLSSQRVHGGRWPQVAEVTRLGVVSRLTLYPLIRSLQLS